MVARHSVLPFLNRLSDLHSAPRFLYDDTPRDACSCVAPYERHGRNCVLDTDVIRHHASHGNVRLRNLATANRDSIPGILPWIRVEDSGH